MYFGLFLRRIDMNKHIIMMKLVNELAESDELITLESVNRMCDVMLSALTTIEKARQLSEKELRILEKYSNKLIEDL